MLGKLDRYFCLIRQYGLRRCFFRIAHDYKARSGRLKKRFPVWDWDNFGIEYWSQGLAPSRPAEYRAFRQNSPVRFFFPLGKPPEIPREYTGNATEEADNILQGKFRYFSNLWGQLGYPKPDWMKNPFIDKRGNNQKHWCDLADFDPAQGDIKYIWEPSRFCWAYALVRAYATWRDDEYAEAFWNLTESWMETNPPQMGPNWRCGQEIAIRVMACIFGLYAFWESPATTDKRIVKMITLLAGSAERIAENIDYARAQMGNHATSEAAGLYTVGVLFPELADSPRWRKLGKWVLEDEARQFNWPDGSYTQHSMNYQRLMLHDYLWCIRLGEINGEEFSPLTRERIRASYEFMYQLQDASGRVPNYGPNDGALILPLNDCDYADYRPVIGAMSYLDNHKQLYPQGQWSEDLVWLFGRKSLDSKVAVPVRKSSDFATGGYYTLRGGKSWAMIRCHTYRNRPNQADMLHLDLWWDGINVLRDSGSFSYYDPIEKWNQYFPSTAAHNTIVVGRSDQMIKGERFQWYSLVRSKFIRHLSEGTMELWQGEHYGYTRLKSRAVHRRTVCRLGDMYWVIIDDILGRRSDNMQLFWHLPDLPLKTGDGSVVLDANHRDIDLHMLCSAGINEFRVDRGLNLATRAGWMSLYYGRRDPAPTASTRCEIELPVRYVTILSLGHRVGVTKSDLKSKVLWRAQDGPEQGVVELVPPGDPSGKVVTAMGRDGRIDWRIADTTAGIAQ